MLACMEILVGAIPTWIPCLYIGRLGVPLTTGHTGAGKMKMKHHNYTLLANTLSDMLAPPLASTVSSVMSLGFTARQTIPITFFGFMICSVVVTLTGKIGATYHIPYPVAVRAFFGYVHRIADNIKLKG